MTEHGVIERRSTDITNNTGGGVMTDEVGAVTGELSLRSDLHADSTVALLVQYREADEWYTVTGGTCRIRVAEDLDAVHALAVGLLDRGEG